MAVKLFQAKQETDFRVKVGSYLSIPYGTVPIYLYQTDKRAEMMSIEGSPRIHW
ncbi:unnamed protein product [Haemonchus placei]|uniref:dUTP diphosphatase n=1 Tax=Haemonchus placei TaxID=6290 RepID=A0A0N4XA44_HAEPC|nr:unnamed protein product [Haemonchus placei]